MAIANAGTHYFIEGLRVENKRLLVINSSPFVVHRFQDEWRYYDG